MAKLHTLIAWNLTTKHERCWGWTISKKVVENLDTDVDGLGEAELSGADVEGADIEDVDIDESGETDTP